MRNEIWVLPEENKGTLDCDNSTKDHPTTNSPLFVSLVFQNLFDFLINLVIRLPRCFLLPF